MHNAYDFFYSLNIDQTVWHLRMLLYLFFKSDSLPTKNKILIRNNINIKSL